MKNREIRDKRKQSKELGIPSHSLRLSDFPEDSCKAAMASSLLCSASMTCTWRALLEF
jgi:hypothetical protein